MDYQIELKRLKEAESNLISDFWKPEPGQYKVKALTEIEDADPYEKEGEEPQLRKKVQVKIESKEYTWNFPFGRTSSSTYGQLCHLASVKGNKLKDVEFTAVVVGTGQNRRFTIVM